METEREEFDAAVEKYRECYGVSHGGCGCTGNCLGHHLSKIRKKYDDDHEGEEYWLSDQLHGYLKKRPGDSGRTGAAIDADNYWSGVQ